MPFDFSPYQAVLLDLDGTLCDEDHPLPGGQALLARLLAQRKNIACLSNSTQSPQRIVRRLASMGMNLPAELIFTASQAAVDYCLQKYAPRPRVFNLATEGVQEMLEGRVTWVHGDSNPCDAVIIGNPTCVWAHEPRQRIALELLRRGAACLGLCADRVFPSPRGLEIGSGAMTWMLAYAADVKPIFFGKPQKDFFNDVCTRLGVSSPACVLIGDNLESDIAGAKGVGMHAILSLSGVTRRKDLADLAKDRSPDWVVENLSELVG